MCQVCRNTSALKQQMGLKMEKQSSAVGALGRGPAEDGYLGKLTLVPTVFLRWLVVITDK
jgi:hypothetical protein